MTADGNGGVSRGTFGSLGFILAAAGSAVGLGNLWKFPYMAHRNGGGAFVLVYLGAVLLLGLPIMLAEIGIGRRTRANPVKAFRLLGGPAWSLVGWLGVVTGFLILSYYNIVAGWTLHYVGRCLGWSLNGFGPAEAARVAPEFMAFLGDGSSQLLLHGLFMGLTAGVVACGVQKGIEQASKLLMPVLFLILLALMAAAAATPSCGEALATLFHFRLSDITARGALEAVGQAFFSLSLGMGAMLTYGSYVSRRQSLPRAALMIGGLDTLVALMASVVMFTIILGVPEAERAGKFGASSVILFTTLPEMLYGLPLGTILAPAFFLLVVFAALTSTISLMEVLTSWFLDQLGWRRLPATLLMALAAFGLGIPSALSNGADAGLTGFSPLGARATGFFDTADYLAANFCLPLGGLLIALFAGWVLAGSATKAEIEEGHGRFLLHGPWRLALRFVCPAAIGWILYAVLFQGVKFN